MKKIIIALLTLTSVSAFADCPLRVHRQNLNGIEWTAAQKAFLDRGYIAEDARDTLWQHGDAEPITNATSKESHFAFAQTSLGSDTYTSNAVRFGKASEEKTRKLMIRALVKSIHQLPRCK